MVKEEEQRANDGEWTREDDRERISVEENVGGDQLPHVASMWEIDADVFFFWSARSFCKVKLLEFLPEHTCCSNCVHLVSQYCFFFANNRKIQAAGGTNTATVKLRCLPTDHFPLSYWLPLSP